MKVSRFFDMMYDIVGNNELADTHIHGSYIALVEYKDKISVLVYVELCILGDRFEGETLSNRTQDRCLGKCLVDGRAAVNKTDKDDGDSGNASQCLGPCVPTAVLFSFLAFWMDCRTFSSSSSGTGIF